ncbi:uncharacterized protein FOMMEDRAFT_161713 [Fomitiporia mediterranea MF3/22]|uniref:uncharacterized protein n=1 Tax=Fomitiporia mediterranea (strain MF3/22) TaxID=694068 RepID=UPI0004408C3C|nr:uncharacterized protein FOMMEDRAFT_161713 [Fomitiporia mediterranea MF3/22]EJC98353.1 hypothetical protein FOMMEDRAFT_161713 [Fomitiporia mediterranea MF3/22]
MTSTSTGADVALTVISVSNIKWDSTRPPNLYVQIKFLNDKRWTKTCKENIAPKWNEGFLFKRSFVDQRIAFAIQIKHDSSYRKECVGKIEIELDELLKRCSNGKETELYLNAPHGLSSTKTAALRVRLEALDAMASARRRVDAAEQAIQRGGFATSAHATDSIAVGVADATTDHFAKHADLYESVGSLVSTLDVFVRVVDKLSQMSDSPMCQGLRHQFEVDKKVVELVHAMIDAFDFVEKNDILHDRTDRLQTTVIQLLKQTEEFCLFIQEYTSRNILRRVFMQKAEGTIDKFLKAFQASKSSIDSGILVQVGFVSSRISFNVDALTSKVNELSSKFDISFLDRLQPERMSAFDRPQCLPGTRRNIMDEIVEWVSSGSNQNVFWLDGVARSGKSTISTTIAEHFSAISRLGAHLFFQRGKSEPSAVIRTLAYKLALFDSSIAEHVIEAIVQDSDIALASGTTQSEKLIKIPLDRVGEALQGPVTVIVLDALDECGTDSGRRRLLELFREGLPTLPENFRFLITSRKELDIDQALSSQPESVCAVELEHDSVMCKIDVLRYIDYEMRKVFTKSKLETVHDWQLKMERLGDAAGGLFIWASTAVKLVDRDFPARRLNHLVSKSQLLSALDTLYRTVLETSGISFDDEESRSHFSQVLGLILLCKVPLSDDAIDGILGYSDEDSSRLVLSRLRSVLAYTSGEPIRFCHTSFRDYLLAPGRERDDWFINLEFQKTLVATQCFSVMKNGLRFNICNQESSYILNDQIPDLPDRIKENIPPT